MHVAGVGSQIAEIATKVMRGRISSFIKSLSALSPFLVFEVLEGQIDNFLDESIQERVKGDLDEKKR